MSKFVDARKVVRGIKDHSTIALTGFGGIGQCDKVLREIRDSFLRTGHPNNLTIYHAAGQSDNTNGIEYIAEEGLIRRVIGGHWGLAPKVRKLIEENKIEAYCFPQGQLTHLFRTIANRLPGQLSPIGIGTFVDPRLDGGKINEKAKASGEDFVQLLSIGEEEFLFYRSPHFDYVLIRGTTADEAGNITTEEEPLKLEILSAAQAAKACGGKVIAQVKYIAQKNSFHPKDVVVPGYLVDEIVVADQPEMEHRQVPSSVYNPVYCGNLRSPVEVQRPLPLDIRKVIGLRAVKELKKSSVVNLGIGIPGDVIGPITVELNLLDDIYLTVESGAVGGIPVGSNEFGLTKNADAILDHAYQFDHYHGAGVDLAFMGAAEIDRYGNVNVSKFGGRIVGCGGFMDVTQPAKEIVFCSTFTNGGLRVAVENGRLIILKEGRNRKFVRDVQHITFSGPYAASRGKKVTYVTERAVFVLTPEGLELTEIAPGVDLEQDILYQMDFRPVIKNVKTMELDVFGESNLFRRQ